VYMCDCNCSLLCVKNLHVHCIIAKGLKITSKMCFNDGMAKFI
jgi:hypothetical protein